MSEDETPEPGHRTGTSPNIIRSWLQENEYADTSSDEDVFDLLFETDEGELSVRMIASDDSGWVLLVAHGDFAIEPEHAPAVLDACNRINYQQLVGAVSFDPAAPDVQCRFFLPHPPGALDRQVFCGVVEAWLGNAMRCLAALRRVAEGKDSPEVATAWLEEVDDDANDAE
jgi:hypothetical protein